MLMERGRKIKFAKKYRESKLTRKSREIILGVRPSVKMVVKGVQLAEYLVRQSPGRPQVCSGVVQNSSPPWFSPFDFWGHQSAVASPVHISGRVRNPQSVRLVGQAAAKVTDHQERLVW